METNHKLTPRGERYNTHTYVTIQSNRFFSLTPMSGVLLDISSSGFKIELVGNKLSLEAGKRYWLSIPLHQLGVLSPSKLSLKIECVWIDQDKYICGGIFLETSTAQKELIESVIGILIERLPSSNAL